MTLDSLAKKALVSIIIILLLINITFVISYQSNKKYLNRFINESLMLVSEAYEGQVYQFLEMSKRRVQDFASDGLIRNSMKKLIEGDRLTVHEINGHLMKKMSLDNTIHLIYIQSLDGRVISSTDSVEIGKDVSGSDFFRNARDGSMITENLSGYKGMPALAISSPIKDPVSGESAGYITNFIFLKELDHVLSGEMSRQLGSVSWNKGMAKTMKAYIVNRDKLMLTGSRLTDGVLKQQVDTVPVNECLQSNREIVGFYSDYRGLEVAGASRCFPSLKWTMLIEMDKAEVLMPLTVIRTSAVSTGFLFILFSSVLFVLFLRGVVRPIGRIVSALNSIAHGNLKINIPVDSTDEIGELSASFNNMVHELRNRGKELMKLSAVIENSINVVFITDIRGTIEYVNPMFEKVTGWAKEDALGKNPRILASGETAKEEYDELWKTITAGKTWRGAFKNKRKDGGFYWGNAVITPIKNERGDITNFLSVQEDVTEKRRSEERAQYLSSCDEMTGLINRARFMDMLRVWIHEKTRNMQGVLLLLDMDEFKFLNDTYGHSLGDELIRTIGSLLEAEVKESEYENICKSKGVILGRMGGDEFSIFLPGLAAVEGLGTAEYLRKKIEALRLVELPAYSTVSIGVVAYPEHGETVKELLTKADAALYRAKEQGRNRCHLYRPEDLDLENIHSRLKEKERILKTIEEDRFIPWFQPLLHIPDGEIHHYEALARMRDTDGKILFPGDFINAAEIFGLIGVIDRIITEKTMRLQAEMARQGRKMSFAMNLSGKNLGDEELLSFLRSKIDETGADPACLTFEITETAAVRDINRAIRFINALKSIGCSFSLDDFGVGFTSFMYLKEMQVDYIKIDGLFIKNLHENPSDQLFVKAIIDVARGMGIETVAEFVEKEETLSLLKEFGVDYAQGYLIGKPTAELLADA